jgi:hypothetical protein
MTFSVAHWDTLDDSLRLICKGKFSLSVRMESVMCLHFSMQEEDILACTHPK